MDRRSFAKAIVAGTAAQLTAWSNAAALPIARPRGEWVTFNVRDFGARGDGATDDSAAFVRALSAAALRGGVVVVPVGVYPLLPMLRVSSGVTIRGEGEQSMLRRVGGDPIVLLCGNAQGATVQDLAISGSFSHGVLLERCTASRVSGCHISGATVPRSGYANGIFVVGSNDVTVEGCQLRGNGGDGFTGADIQCNGLGARSRDIHVLNNDCHSTDAAVNILCYDTSGSEIRGNNVSGARVKGAQNHGYGILLYASPPNPGSCFDNTVSANRVSFTGGSGIYLMTSNNSRVTGNTIEDVAAVQDDQTLPVAAIALNQSQFVTVDDNTISRAGRAGISIASNRAGVGHVTVRRNIITNVGGYGIHLRGILEDIQVVENTVTATNGGIGGDTDAAQDNIVVVDNILSAISTRGGIKLRNACGSRVERNTLIDCSGYAVDLTFRDMPSTAVDNVVRQTSASTGLALVRVTRKQ